MPEAPIAEANAAADLEQGSAASKPKPTTAKAKQPKAGKELPSKANLNDRIFNKIRASRPRNTDAGTVDIVHTSKAILSAVRYVITTGIAPFDDLVGAFPVGRISELYGPEACGKTQMVIRTAVRAQTLCISEVVRDKTGITFKPVDKKKCHIYVVYIDNEGSIDDDQKIVVDGTRLKVDLVRCDTVDQLFKVADITVDEVAKQQKADPDTIYFVLIVVDTVASTSSKQEMTQDWGTEDYSRHAKQYSQGFRIMARKVNRCNVAMICTNQIRDKYTPAQKGKKMMRSSGLQPDDGATFGGKALKFYATNRVYMEKVRDYKTNPKSKFHNGLLIGFKSAKNRLKKPGREGRLVILFGDENGVGGGFSNEFSILETLLYLKFVEYSEATKNLIFKFARHGIPTTTFDDSEMSTTLDEDDAEESSSKRGKKDPFISVRAQWPAFYADHKADIDKLYEAAIAAAFAAEAVPVDGEEDYEDETQEED